MSKRTAPLPDWESVLSSAAHPQEMLPGAVLVGGTAAAIHANHRISLDADHVLTDLRSHFDRILMELESVAGWQANRIARPVRILGSLDGIETGVRQLIRTHPLDTMEHDHRGSSLTIPTSAEILRIKGVLILKRNAARDYIDFAALADHLGTDRTVAALRSFDRLYPQENGESALQQLQAQLANPLPYDEKMTDLSKYRNLDPKWHDWYAIKTTCRHVSIMVFDRVCEEIEMDE